MNSRKVLVVLSGGQDSATCLLHAKHSGMFDEVHAISFDYGQKHRVELDAAERVAHLVGVASHRIVNLQGLLQGRSPLVNPSTPLETYESFRQMDAVIGDRVELTFVPLRNLMFLVVAANHALALDCFHLMTGVCQMDNANYPDCTQQFIEDTQRAMREALGMYRNTHRGPQLSILTPLINYTKAETVRMAFEYPGGEAVMAETHTCYAGGTPPCGSCHACVLRAEGFRQAGVADPLVEKWRLANGKHIGPDNRIFTVGN